MKPDPQQVRVLSRVISEAEGLWRDLPNNALMRHHFEALQKSLANMLGDLPARPPKPERQLKPKPCDRLAIALDGLGRPDALSLIQLREIGDDGIVGLLAKGTHHIAPHLAKCGYVRVSNPDDLRGLWPVVGSAFHSVVFARSDLSEGDQFTAAIALRPADQEDRGAGREKSAPSLGHQPPTTKSLKTQDSASEPCPTTEQPE